MSRVKCPNCGSGAQTRLIWEDATRYSTELIREYRCGCGCTFRAIFEVKETNILKIKAPQ